MIAQMAREERWEFPGQGHAPIDCAEKQIISLQKFQPDSVSTETMTHQGGNPTFSHSTKATRTEFGLVDVYIVFITSSMQLRTMVNQSHSIACPDEINGHGYYFPKK